MTATRSLRLIFKPCRRTRAASREVSHEDRCHRCALSPWADVHGLRPERLSSVHSSASAAESTRDPVPCRRQCIAFCGILLRTTGACRTVAALWLLCPACPRCARCRALQHSRVSSDDGAGQHRSRADRLCVVDPGFSSVPRKLQRHLQREAGDAGINCFQHAQAPDDLKEEIMSANIAKKGIDMLSNNE